MRWLDKQCGFSNTNSKPVVYKTTRFCKGNVLRDRWKVVSTTHWHLPSISTRIKSYAAAAADFQHPLRGVHGEQQKWATLLLWGKWQNRASDSWIFSGASFRHPVLVPVPLRIQKSAKILHGDDYSSWLEEIFCKKIWAWLHVFPLYQNHIYTDLALCLLEVVSQTYPKSVSWVIVLILPQIKLNLQLAPCAFLSQ